MDYGYSYICQEIEDFDFKIPRSYIQTLLLMKSPNFQERSNLQIKKFLINLKLELSENFYMSPYGEQIYAKFIKQKKYLDHQKEQLEKLRSLKIFNNSLIIHNKELMETNENLKSIVENLTQKIEQYENLTPHPPQTNKTETIEDKT